MPSTSQARHDRIVSIFGTDLDLDDRCQEYLSQRGFYLTRTWDWIPPPRINKLGDLTDEEFECVMYLIEEWDFGGVLIGTGEDE